MRFLYGGSRLFRRGTGRQGEPGLGGGELAPLSHREAAETESADGDALEPARAVAERFEHAADFAVFALAEDEDVAAGSFGADGESAEGFAVVLHARGGEEPDVGGGERAVGGHLVSLARAVARMRELFDPRAVVGEKDEPLAVLVEAARGNEADAGDMDQIQRLFRGVRVLGGAHIAARLVQHDIDVRSDGFDRFSVQGHAVAGTDADGGIGADFAVDGHMPGLDEFGGMSPGSGPGGRQELRKVRVRIGIRHRVSRRFSRLPGRRDAFWRAG